jgi:PAS domain S-box-containing protein
MRILLVEDNPGDVRLLREYLAEAGAGRFELTHVDRLSTGLERLADTSFDAVLLDLSLPDSQGLATLVRVHAAARDVPFVVLTGVEDETLGTRLVQAGAQDYLVKGQVTGLLLTRSLRHAVERKRAEQARLDSEERFQSIVHSTNDAIIVMDSQGEVAFWNRGAETMFGYAAEEMLGRPVAGIVPERFRDAHRRGVQRAAAAGRLAVAGKVFELVGLRKDGTEFPLELTLASWKAKVGLFFTGIIRDTTERNRAEETLRERTRVLRSILRSMGEGVVVTAPDGTPVLLNPAAKQIFGMPPGEATPVEGMRPFGLSLPDMIVDDPKTDLPFLRVLQRAAANGVAISVRPLGSSQVTWLSVSARLLRDDTGAERGWVIVFRDVTRSKQAEEALRESEERFRAIMGNSPTMIFLKDTEGRYLQVNRKFEDSFHVANRDVVGKTDQDIFPPEQAAAFRANDRKVFEAGRPLEFEEVALHDDGPHTSIVVKFPLLNVQGRYSALCGIVTDITDRKRGEEQLQSTLSQLRTLSQRLDTVREEERIRIARELHDELGVRLTCLKLDLARLLSLMGGSLFPREKMEEKIRSMTAEVDSTIASVQRLVAELRPGILDDLGLVAAIEWQCQDFERRSGTRCVCKASQEEIHLDRSHATAAFRICQEALTNVARHAEATSVRVLVEQVNGELLLEIQDDGKGISAEQLADSGSLGLLGMRERARGLGGRLEIAGRPEKGTTVTLRLPCSEQAERLTRK